MKIEAAVPLLLSVAVLGLLYATRQTSKLVSTGAWDEYSLSPRISSFRTPTLVQSVFEPREGSRAFLLSQYNNFMRSPCTSFTINQITSLLSQLRQSGMSREAEFARNRAVNAIQSGQIC